MLGSGEMIWEDFWRDDCPLSSYFPRLNNLSWAHKSSIQSMITSFSVSISWDFKFFRNLNDRKIDELSSVLSFLEGVDLRPLSLLGIMASSLPGVFSCESYLDVLKDESDVPIFPTFKMI